MFPPLTPRKPFDDLVKVRVYKKQYSITEMVGALQNKNHKLIEYISYVEGLKFDQAIDYKYLSSLF
jgi:hypothetical protein